MFEKMLKIGNTLIYFIHKVCMVLEYFFDSLKVFRTGVRIFEHKQKT